MISSDKKKQPYIVYSLSLMRYLDNLGFKFFLTRPDKKNSNRVIFIYDNTEELVAAINSFKK